MKKILSQEDLNREIAVVVGTRPGIIKFSPVIRALQAHGQAFFIIHTGQHYSYNMDKQFFDDLGLPEPRHHNEHACKEKLHGAQTASMIVAVEKALLESRPGMVIVGGDANTNFAAAVATRKLGIKLAHMEAGLRSNDWRMPEEHNRVMIDHISELLFSPTENTKQNLTQDNVKGKIYVVGNSIVDAVYQNKKIADEKSDILNKLALQEKNYFLITVHREENLDSDENLDNLTQSLQIVARHFKDIPMIFPIHPRTQKRFDKFSGYRRLLEEKNIRIVPPMGYLDFLKLLSDSKVILTDSGGIQEEACVLQVPCVTLRDNTERPETIQVGANKVAGILPENVLSAVKEMMDKHVGWNNPFGDGTTGHQIVEKMIQHLE
jgi:UDP-N-acetylglucosamine 2-epimerase (non-hydrolysing)